MNDLCYYVKDVLGPANNDPQLLLRIPIFFTIPLYEKTSYLAKLTTVCL